MFFTNFFSLLYCPDLESIAFRLEKAYFPTWKDMLSAMKRHAFRNADI